jgi:hypothetical protein
MEKAEADEVVRLSRTRDKAAEAFEVAMQQWRAER